MLCMIGHWSTSTLMLLLPVSDTKISSQVILINPLNYLLHSYSMVALDSELQLNALTSHKYMCFLQRNFALSNILMIKLLPPFSPRNNVHKSRLPCVEHIPLSTPGRCTCPFCKPIVMVMSSIETR